MRRWIALDTKAGEIAVINTAHIESISYEMSSPKIMMRSGNVIEILPSKSNITILNEMQRER